jgi:predicted acetyltransferase
MPDWLCLVVPLLASIARALHDPAMIRNADHDDISELAGLWTRAFPGERTVEQRVRHLETGGVFGGIETAYVAERAGRMVGAFRAYALTQHMHGTPFRMMGLASVAVDESARRRGVGRELCEQAVRIARERGDTLSVLYPFRPAFYQSLGWGMTGELRAHRFRPESLTSVGDGSGVVRATADDTTGIAACYDRAAAETNGLIARTPRMWRSHLEGDSTHAYTSGSDSIRGYMIVRFGRSAAPDDKPLFVREIVTEDHDAYLALLGWIAAQRDAWRLVHYDAAPDERFDHRLDDPRIPGFQPARYLWAPVARVIRGPMLRVLDVRRALEQRLRWGGAAPMGFGLQVIDPLVPENEGPFEVDFDGSRASVRRATGARPLLRLPAAAFARVFAGELSVRDALNIGIADCIGDAAAVDSLFRVDRCFRLLDEF